MNYDEKIADASKSIYNYCLSRTSNPHDAEDLAQDILVELIKSVGNLRDEKAFYGFMWGIAGNVYKQWYRKKVSRIDTDELDDNMDVEDIIEDESDMDLLRRELSLLSEKYRKATILYYMKNNSCAEISRTLEISESMVKYLLFKSRQILKEGISMNRTYGELSYNPKNLMLNYWGDGPNRFSNIAEDNLIAQNILWACYNDSLVDNEIALQIGSALPYIEKDLQMLLATNLLIKNGNKYSTNVVIISDEYYKEVESKVSDNQNKYAEMVNKFITDKKDEIMNLGIDMSDNTYKWQMATKLLYEIWTNFTDSYDIDTNMPKTAFGERAYVWGVEHFENTIGRSNVSNEYGRIQFLDYGTADGNAQRGDHRNFYGRQQKVDLYIDIILNGKSDFNKFEEELVIEMIMQGYLINKDGKVKSTVPIFTEDQMTKLYEIFTPFYEEANKIVNANMEIAYTVLKNHTPSHLKNQIQNIAYLSGDSFIFPNIIQAMVNKGYLSTDWNAGEMPTTYIVTK